MKTLIILAVLALTVTTPAYADDNKSPDTQASMMQGDMMKNCQMHMKGGKMMDSMPKDMMGKCQEMMKTGGMDNMKPDSTKAETPKAVDDADHKAHHPQ